MSDFTVTKEFNLADNVSLDALAYKLEESFKSEFDKVKVTSCDSGDLNFQCRVKTKLWNPIVTTKGVIKVQQANSKGKVMIDGDTKTNSWFWFTILLGFLFWPLWLLMFFMHSSQKKATAQSFERITRKLDFDLSALSNTPPQAN